LGLKVKENTKKNYRNLGMKYNRGQITSLYGRSRELMEVNLERRSRA
jgi:hypothetical protein